MLKLEKLESDRNFKAEGPEGAPVFNIYRTKIPGGWLVLMRQHDFQFESVSDTYGYGWGYGGMTFVPDPDHKWDGSSLP